MDSLVRVSRRDDWHPAFPGISSHQGSDAVASCEARCAPASDSLLTSATPCGVAPAALPLHQGARCVACCRLRQAPAGWVSPPTVAPAPQRPRQSVQPRSGLDRPVRPLTTTYSAAQCPTPVGPLTYSTNWCRQRVLRAMAVSDRGTVALAAPVHFIPGGTARKPPHAGDNRFSFNNFKFF